MSICEVCGRSAVAEIIGMLVIVASIVVSIGFVVWLLDRSDHGKRRYEA
jgi:glycerol-3-phosphate acyltransferase PlsY